MKTFAAPAVLGLAIGIGGYFTMESATSAETAIEPTPARSALAPIPRQETAIQRAAYRNCAAARADGATSIRVGEPGYGAHLDRDSDGVACEPYPR